jgi:outer membrane protein TolC
MRQIGIWMVLAGACIPAMAQTNVVAGGKALSLRDCVQMAITNNLDLQMERYAATIPFYDLRAAYGAYDPSLTLSGQHDHSRGGTFTYFTTTTNFSSQAVSDDNTFSGSIDGGTPWGMSYTLGTSSGEDYNNFGSDSSSSRAYVQLRQELLKDFWIDSGRLTIRVAKNRVKYSEQTLRMQIMQTLAKVEQAYYDLIYDQENIRVQEKAVELAKRLVEENKKKVEVGSMAPLDEKQAESQAASSQAALIAARSALAVQEATMKQLVSHKYSEWTGVSLLPSGTLEAPRQFFSLQDSWSKGLSQRPEMVQSKLDLEKAGITLEYDKNQLFPQLQAFGTYGYSGGGREFSDALDSLNKADRLYYTYGGKMVLPLSNVKARNNYRADKVSKEQAFLAVKKMERDIMYAIETDIRQAQSSYEQVAARQAAREYAEAALQAEQTKLENGKSTTYTVLQMQRDLTSARGDEIQALANYNKALSQLSLDEGTILERLNVRMEVK